MRPPGIAGNAADTATTRDVLKGRTLGAVVQPPVFVVGVKVRNIARRKPPGRSWPGAFCIILGRPVEPVLAAGEQAGVEKAGVEEQQEGHPQVQAGRVGVIDGDDEVECHAQFAQRQQGPAA